MYPYNINWYEILKQLLQLLHKLGGKWSEATFSLTGEDEAELIEGVWRFNYFGRLLDRSDNNFPSVLQNIRKARKVWRQIGKVLQREGAEMTVSARFYRAAVLAVLLFGVET